jgi:hypothetical protein
MIRLLLVDDQKRFAGFRMRLALENDIDVIGKRMTEDERHGSKTRCDRDGRRNTGMDGITAANF